MSEQIVSAEPVLAAVAAGLSGAAVARSFGISRERVRQIVKRATGAGIPVRGARCRVCGAADMRDGSHRRDPGHVAAIYDRKVARFWSRVDKSGACWLWRGGSRTPRAGRASGYGYGASGLLRERGAGGYAHRVAYLLTKGDIAPGLQIDHLCRNGRCVNPAHLEAVTPRQNVLRSPIAVAARNARKTHCPKGHPYSGANLYVGRNGHSRACRECRRLRAAA